MNWIYKDKEMTKDEDFNLFGYRPDGFVYIITNIMTGQYYIGKKSIKRGTKWQNYFGSSEDLKNDIKEYGKDIFKREILDICRTKKQVTYSEIAHQIKYDVLRDSNSYNRNIAGKFYRKDLK